MDTVHVETYSRALALAAEREHREVMRQHETSATVSMQMDSAAAADLIRLFQRANGFDHDPFDDADVHRALAIARRPVIRDQGPPPVRRQPTPRPMHPPPRRLSWLVEGRGR
ncbi:MAG: hypothetical protein EPO40_19610 [Myxococcaceae bacterium]|nr:MAG: hypothetical protein EPO40_19610 [Myxococcaceae bacterium]